MAMDLGGAKGGVKSDINVTPLVDVMLVLLIIMMLVAPILQQGVRSRCRPRRIRSTSPESRGQTAIAICGRQGPLSQRQGRCSPRQIWRGEVNELLG